jgi:exodeoxyribonuclease V beta subunit
VLWWAAGFDSGHSPLGRLLFARDQDGNVAAKGASPPADQAFGARLAKLGEAAPGAISVELVSFGLPSSWQSPSAQVSDLRAARLHRDLDLRWRRTSYSDITAAAHETWVGSEPEQPLVTDEPPLPESIALLQDDDGGHRAPAVAVESDGAGQVPLAAMAFGTEIGTFVHRVLEATEFDAADLPGEVAARIEQVQAWRSVEIGSADAVVHGLCEAIQTPLGPVLGGLALSDFRRPDRLDELGFELPLAGGDRPHGWAELDTIATLLRQMLPAADPLAGYAKHLVEGELRRRVRGYLTGSLDLVLRVAGDGPPRFAVLDYKTNWLGEIDEPLTAERYHPDALAAEMRRHHYALQALLYLVALHRFLRWRQPGYDPDRDIAGAVYLFLRGMTGAAAPILAGGAPAGVFGWTPPRGLVPALSDALDAREMAGR